MTDQPLEDNTPVTKKVEKKAGEDDLFGDILDESMEELLSDFKGVYAVSTDNSQKPVLSSPIIEILQNQGYIKGELKTEEELQKVPEYEVLRLIIRDHPIPLSELEDKTEIDSLSMALSNLQADKLIEYTNDYQWTISRKLKDMLLEFIHKSKEDEELTTRESAQYRREVQRNTKFERQFIMGMYQIGVIEDLDLPLHKMMAIPEFSILRTVKDNEPISLERIQKSVKEITPIQISEVISRLEGSNYIQQTDDENYELTDKLIELLGDKSHH